MNLGSSGKEDDKWLSLGSVKETLVAYYQLQHVQINAEEQQTANSSLLENNQPQSSLHSHKPAVLLDKRYRVLESMFAKSRYNDEPVPSSSAVNPASQQNRRTRRKLNQLRRRVLRDYDIELSRSAEERFMMSSGLLSQSQTQSAREEEKENTLHEFKRDDLCTFTETARNFKVQRWYNCRTCGLTANTGCCEVCVVRCHLDHDVSYRKTGKFYCDCGSGHERVSCKALKPLKLKEMKELEEVNNKLDAQAPSYSDSKLSKANTSSLAQLYKKMNLGSKNPKREGEELATDEGSKNVGEHKSESTPEADLSFQRLHKLAGELSGDSQMHRYIDDPRCEDVHFLEDLFKSLVSECKQNFQRALESGSTATLETSETLYSLSALALALAQPSSLLSLSRYLIDFSLAFPQFELPPKSKGFMPFKKMGVKFVDWLDSFDLSLVRDSIEGNKGDQSEDKVGLVFEWEETEEVEYQSPIITSPALAHKPNAKPKVLTVGKNGKYLYLLCCKFEIKKIGTGLFGTERNRIYTRLNLRELGNMSSLLSLSSFFEEGLTPPSVPSHHDVKKGKDRQDKKTRQEGEGNNDYIPPICCVGDFIYLLAWDLKNNSKPRLLALNCNDLQPTQTLTLKNSLKEGPQKTNAYSWSPRMVTDGRYLYLLSVENLIDGERKHRSEDEAGRERGRELEREKGRERESRYSTGNRNNQSMNAFDVLMRSMQSRRSSRGAGVGTNNSTAASTMTNNNTAINNDGSHATFCPGLRIEIYDPTEVKDTAKEKEREAPSALSFLSPIQILSLPLDYDAKTLKNPSFPRTLKLALKSAIIYTTGEQIVFISPGNLPMVSCPIPNKYSVQVYSLRSKELIFRGLTNLNPGHTLASYNVNSNRIHTLSAYDYGSETMVRYACYENYGTVGSRIRAARSRDRSQQQQGLGQTAGSKDPVKVLAALREDNEGLENGFSKPMNLASWILAHMSRIASHLANHKTRLKSVCQPHPVKRVVLRWLESLKEVQDAERRYEKCKQEQSGRSVKDMDDIEVLLRSGATIEAKCGVSGSRSGQLSYQPWRKAYRGRVMAIRYSGGDASYDVKFEDGERVSDVKRSEIISVVSSRGELLQVGQTNDQLSGSQLDTLAMLEAMGFSKSACIYALKQTGWNIERAVDYITTQVEAVAMVEQQFLISQHSIHEEAEKIRKAGVNTRQPVLDALSRSSVALNQVQTTLRNLGLEDLVITFEDINERFRAATEDGAKQDHKETEEAEAVTKERKRKERKQQLKDTADRITDIDHVLNNTDFGSLADIKESVNRIISLRLLSPNCRRAKYVLNVGESFFLEALDTLRFLVDSLNRHQRSTSPKSLYPKFSAQQTSETLAFCTVSVLKIIELNMNELIATVDLRSLARETARNGKLAFVDDLRELLIHLATSEIQSDKKSRSICEASTKVILAGFDLFYPSNEDRIILLTSFLTRTAEAKEQKYPGNRHVSASLSGLGSPVPTARSAASTSSLLAPNHILFLRGLFSYLAIHAEPRYTSPHRSKSEIPRGEADRTSERDDTKAREGSQSGGQAFRGMNVGGQRNLEIHREGGEEEEEEEKEVDNVNILKVHASSVFQDLLLSKYVPFHTFVSLLTSFLGAETTNAKAPGGNLAFANGPFSFLAALTREIIIWGDLFGATKRTSIGEAFLHFGSVRQGRGGDVDTGIAAGIPDLTNETSQLVISLLESLSPLLDRLFHEMTQEGPPLDESKSQSNPDSNPIGSGPSTSFCHSIEPHLVKMKVERAFERETSLRFLPVLLTTLLSTRIRLECNLPLVQRLLQGLHTALDMLEAFLRSLVSYSSRCLQSHDRLGSKKQGGGAASLQQRIPWGAQAGMDRSKMIETGHPYGCGKRMFLRHLHFPGATHIRLLFDPRCCTEGQHDQVKLFADSACTQLLPIGPFCGNHLDSNLNFPEKPILVARDRVTILFEGLTKPEVIKDSHQRKEEETKARWGLRIRAEGLLIPGDAWSCDAQEAAVLSIEQQHVSELGDEGKDDNGDDDDDDDDDDGNGRHDVSIPHLFNSGRALALAQALSETAGILITSLISHNIPDLAGEKERGDVVTRDACSEPSKSLRRRKGDVKARDREMKERERKEAEPNNTNNNADAATPKSLPSYLTSSSLELSKRRSSSDASLRRLYDLAGLPLLNRGYSTSQTDESSVQNKQPLQGSTSSTMQRGFESHYVRYIGKAKSWLRSYISGEKEAAGLFLGVGDGDKILRDNVVKLYVRRLNPELRAEWLKSVRAIIAAMMYHSGLAFDVYVLAFPELREKLRSIPLLETEILSERLEAIFDCAVLTQRSMIHQVQALKNWGVLVSEPEQPRKKQFTDNLAENTALLKCLCTYKGLAFVEESPRSTAAKLYQVLSHERAILRTSKSQRHDGSGQRTGSPLLSIEAANCFPHLDLNNLPKRHLPLLQVFHHVQSLCLAFLSFESYCLPLAARKNKQFPSPPDLLFRPGGEAEDAGELDTDEDDDELPEINLSRNLSVPVKRRAHRVSAATRRGDRGRRVAFRTDENDAAAEIDEGESEDGDEREDDGAKRDDSAENLELELGRTFSERFSSSTTPLKSTPRAVRGRLGQLRNWIDTYRKWKAWSVLGQNGSNDGKSRNSDNPRATAFSAVHNILTGGSEMCGSDLILMKDQHNERAELRNLGFVWLSKFMHSVTNSCRLRSVSKALISIPLASLQFVWKTLQGQGSNEWETQSTLHPSFILCGLELAEREKRQAIILSVQRVLSELSEVLTSPQGSVVAPLSPCDDDKKASTTSQEGTTIGAQHLTASSSTPVPLPDIIALDQVLGIPLQISNGEPVFLKIRRKCFERAVSSIQTFINVYSANLKESALSLSVQQELASVRQRLKLILRFTTRVLRSEQRTLHREIKKLQAYMLTTLAELLSSFVSLYLKTHLVRVPGEERENLGLGPFLTFFLRTLKRLARKAARERQSGRERGMAAPNRNLNTSKKRRVPLGPTSSKTMRSQRRASEKNISPSIPLSVSASMDLAATCLALIIHSLDSSGNGSKSDGSSSSHPVPDPNLRCNPSYTRLAMRIARVIWVECEPKEMVGRFAERYRDLAKEKLAVLRGGALGLVTYLVEKLGELECPVRVTEGDAGGGIAGSGSSSSSSTTGKRKMEGESGEGGLLVSPVPKADGRADGRANSTGDVEVAQETNKKAENKGRVTKQKFDDLARGKERRNLFKVVVHRSKKAEEMLDEDQWFEIFRRISLPKAAKWAPGFGNDTSSTTAEDSSEEKIRENIFRESQKHRSLPATSVHVFNNSCSSSRLEVSGKSSAQGHCNFRVEARVTGGKWYFEAELSSTNCTSFAIGWGTQKFNPKYQSAGYDRHSWVYQVHSGLRLHKDRPCKYAEPQADANGKLRKGTIIGCRLNVKKGRISYFLNSKPLGIAFDNISGTNYPQPLYPIVCISPGSRVRVNVQSRKFKSHSSCYAPYYLPLSTDTSKPIIASFYPALNAPAALAVKQARKITDCFEKELQTQVAIAQGSREGCLTVAQRMLRLLNYSPGVVLYHEKLLPTVYSSEVFDLVNTMLADFSCKDGMQVEHKRCSLWPQIHRSIASDVTSLLRSLLLACKSRENFLRGAAGGATKLGSKGFDNSTNGKVNVGNSKKKKRQEVCSKANFGARNRLQSEVVRGQERAGTSAVGGGGVDYTSSEGHRSSGGRAAPASGGDDHYDQGTVHGERAKGSSIFASDDDGLTSSATLSATSPSSREAHVPLSSASHIVMISGQHADTWAVNLSTLLKRAVSSTPYQLSTCGWSEFKVLLASLSVLGGRIETVRLGGSVALPVSNAAASDDKGPIGEVHEIEHQREGTFVHVIVKAEDDDESDQSGRDIETLTFPIASVQAKPELELSLYDFVLSPQIFAALHSLILSPECEGTESVMSRRGNNEGRVTKEARCAKPHFQWRYSELQWRAVACIQALIGRTLEVSSSTTQASTASGAVQSSSISLSATPPISSSSATKVAAFSNLCQQANAPAKVSTVPTPTSATSLSSSYTPSAAAACRAFEPPPTLAQTEGGVLPLEKAVFESLTALLAELAQGARPDGTLRQQLHRYNYTRDKIWWQYHEQEACSIAAPPLTPSTNNSPPIIGRGGSSESKQAISGGLRYEVKAREYKRKCQPKGPSSDAKSEPAWEFGSSSLLRYKNEERGGSSDGLISEEERCRKRLVQHWDREILPVIRRIIGGNLREYQVLDFVAQVRLALRRGDSARAISTIITICGNYCPDGIVFPSPKHNFLLLTHLDVQVGDSVAIQDEANSSGSELARYVGKEARVVAVLPHLNAKKLNACAEESMALIQILNSHQGSVHYVWSPISRLSLISSANKPYLVNLEAALITLPPSNVRVQGGLPEDVGAECLQQGRMLANLIGRKALFSIVSRGGLQALSVPQSLPRAQERANQVQKQLHLIQLAIEEGLSFASLLDLGTPKPEATMQIRRVERALGQILRGFKVGGGAGGSSRPRRSADVKETKGKLLEDEGKHDDVKEGQCSSCIPQESWRYVLKVIDLQLSKAMSGSKSRDYVVSPVPQHSEVQHHKRDSILIKISFPSSALLILQFSTNTTIPESCKLSIYDDPECLNLVRECNSNMSASGKEKLFPVIIPGSRCYVSVDQPHPEAVNCTLRVIPIPASMGVAVWLIKFVAGLETEHTGLNSTRIRLELIQTILNICQPELMSPSPLKETLLSLLCSLLYKLYHTRVLAGTSTFERKKDGFLTQNRDLVAKLDDQEGSKKRPRQKTTSPFEDLDNEKQESKLEVREELPILEEKVLRRFQKLYEEMSQVYEMEKNKGIWVSSYLQTLINVNLIVDSLRRYKDKVVKRVKLRAAVLAVSVTANKEIKKPVVWQCAYCTVENMCNATSCQVCLQPKKVLAIPTNDEKSPKAESDNLIAKRSPRKMFEDMRLLFETIHSLPSSSRSGFRVNADLTLASELLRAAYEESKRNVSSVRRVIVMRNIPHFVPLDTRDIGKIIDSDSKLLSGSGTSSSESKFPKVTTSHGKSSSEDLDRVMDRQVGERIIRRLVKHVTPSAILLPGISIGEYPKWPRYSVNRSSASSDSSSSQHHDPTVPNFTAKIIFRPYTSSEHDTSDSGQEEKGLLYYLGTLKGDGEEGSGYSNPARGKDPYVKVEISDMAAAPSSSPSGEALEASPARLLDRDSNWLKKGIKSGNKPNSWVTITFQKNLYAILTGYSMVVEAKSHPRSWRLEGSNDAKVWTLIKNHKPKPSNFREVKVASRSSSTTVGASDEGRRDDEKDNRAIWGAKHSRLVRGYWELDQERNLLGFSHFRIILTGTNASGRWALTGLRNIEFFGSLGGSFLRDLPLPKQTHRFGVLQLASASGSAVDNVVKALNEKKMDTLIHGLSHFNVQCEPRMVKVEAKCLRDIDDQDLKECIFRQINKDRLFTNGVPKQRLRTAVNEVFSRHVTEDHGTKMPLLEAMDLMTIPGGVDSVPEWLSKSDTASVPVDRLKDHILLSCSPDQISLWLHHHGYDTSLSRTHFTSLLDATRSLRAMSVDQTRTCMDYLIALSREIGQGSILELEASQLVESGLEACQHLKRMGVGEDGIASFMATLKLFFLILRRLNLMFMELYPLLSQDPDMVQLLTSARNYIFPSSKNDLLGKILDLTADQRVPTLSIKVNRMAAALHSDGTRDLRLQSERQPDLTMDVDAERGSNTSSFTSNVEITTSFGEDGKYGQRRGSDDEDGGGDGGGEEKQQVSSSSTPVLALGDPVSRLASRRSFHDTIFASAFRQLRAAPGSRFRVSKPSGAEPHLAFRIITENEQVVGEAGPYRQFFTDISYELQMSTSPLILPSPNHRDNTGDHRDKYVLNPYACESSESMEMLQFLGKLFGVCIRTGVKMMLYFPPIIWKMLSGESVSHRDLRDIDHATTEVLNLFEDLDEKTFRQTFSGETQKFTIRLSDGSAKELKANGSSISVTWHNRLEYVQLALHTRINEQKPALQALRKGLESVVPPPVLNLMAWADLESGVCGRPDIDVAMLKRHTRYSGVKATAPHVKMFWRLLGKFSQEDLRNLIRFCWGQTRLPTSDKEFEATHTRFLIKASAYKDPDKALPRADTCFFNLELPAYSSEDIMKEKLLYAITTVTTMNADQNEDEHAT